MSFRKYLDHDANDDEESDGEEECANCDRVAHNEGFGDLYRVCGCTDRGTMYHFQCLVNEIKERKDASCDICRLKYSHPRISRVQYASVWERVYRSVDQYILIQAIGLVVFGAYMSRLVCTATTIPLVLRILFIISVVFVLAIYFLIIYDYFCVDYRNYFGDYYIVFTHDIDPRNQFAQTVEIYHIEKQDEEQDEEQDDDDHNDNDDDEDENEDWHEYHVLDFAF